jgi:hypothetical protein
LSVSGLQSGLPDAAPAANQPQVRPLTALSPVLGVTALTLAQLVLQFAAQLLLANYFGAGAEVDAYTAALALPVVI